MTATATETPNATPPAPAPDAAGTKLFNDENTVTLTGQLGKDPLLEYLPSGKAVAKFSLASHQSWMKDNEVQKKTNWVDVVMRGDTAVEAASKLRKGDRIRIHGALNYQTWENEDGMKRSKHEIAGFSYDFLRQGKSHQTPQS